MPPAGDQKDQVQQATDIVRLIGEHVALKQKGREWVGLCPFHDDKNPSMHVVPHKQIYKCFVCGAGGDVFSWQKEFHQMSFREALESLADRAGIELEPYKGQGGDPAKAAANRDMRQRLHDANDQALKFFTKSLSDPRLGKLGRDTIDRRGIHPDMIEAFQIGVAPDGWDHLAQTITRQRWDRDAFEKAGLIAPRKQGQGHYDKLRNRLIFPICDAMGRPIAFGGRRLNEEDNPKYLNSPETLLFNKSRTLYGLHLAKRAIMDSHTAVIVEGYTDVIAAHQAGAKNVLATLGTAFTSEHVTELRRFAEKVVLIFDGDDAGQKAAERAVDIFLHGEMDVSLAVLPGGKDPADLFAQEDGVEQWRQCIEQATTALDFLLQQFRKAVEQVDTVTGRQRLATDFMTRLAELGLGKVDPVRRSLILQSLSQTLGLGESMLNEMMLDISRRAEARQRPSGRQDPSNPTQQPPQSPQPSQPFYPDAHEAQVIPPAEPTQDARLWGTTLDATAQAERDVIGCLLQDAALFDMAMDDGRTVDEMVTPGDMVSAVAYRLYGHLYRALSQGEAVTPARMSRQLAEADQNDLVRALTDADSDVDRRTNNDPKRRADVLKGAVAFFVRRQSDAAYRDGQTSLQQSDQPIDDNEKLRRLEAMLKSRGPSATRIARPSGN